MKLEGINWLYMGLACAESVAVPVCLHHCSDLASQSIDIYTGILMLIMEGGWGMSQNPNQVSFLPRVDWLSSARAGAIESAVVVEGASLFVV